MTSRQEWQFHERKLSRMLPFHAESGLGFGVIMIINWAESYQHCNSRARIATQLVPARYLALLVTLPRTMMVSVA